MIVIVIVGILSSVALPSFLNQTLKAKASEAKSDNAAIIKNAASEYQQLCAKQVCEQATSSLSSKDCDPVNGTPVFDSTEFATPVTSTCEGLGAKSQTVSQKFDYFCSMKNTNHANYFEKAAVYPQGTEWFLVVSAIGDSNDSSLDGKVVTNAVILDNGHTELVKDGTCKAFGGNATPTVALKTTAMADAAAAPSAAINCP